MLQRRRFNLLLEYIDKKELDRDWNKTLEANKYQFDISVLELHIAIIESVLNILR